MGEPRRDNGLLKIAVVSGKGGVGKSTITASLAVLLHQGGESIVSVDCDVDAPNLSLLFTRKHGAGSPPLESHATEKASLDPDRCTACNDCINELFCVYKALSWNTDAGQPVVDRFACEGCGACAVLCEQGAFSMGAIHSGTIHVTTVQEGFPLVYGETVIGASTSGKLVSETKDEATKIVEQTSASLVIIDGPPGIGCPVLATVSGMDLVIVVTEPFAAALHDARRAIDVLERFNIPFCVIINRADAWEEGRTTITNYLREQGYEHLGNVPIDMAVPRSVSAMKSIVLFDPASPASMALRSIHQRLASRIASMRDSND